MAAEQEALERIAENQRRFEETRSLRKQYRLCMENEALFARFGVRFPPMKLPGLIGWWIRFRQPVRTGSAMTETGGTVERLREELRNELYAHREGPNEQALSHVDALLAVVEAAQEHKHKCKGANEHSAR